MKNKKTSKALQEIAKLTVTSLKLFNLLPGYRNYIIHSNKKLLEKHNKDKIKAIQKLSGAVEKTGRKIKGGNTMEQTKRDTKKLETILENVEEATSSFTENLKTAIKEQTVEDKEIRENIKILAHLVTTISKLDNIINKKEPSFKVNNTYINNDPNLV